LTRWPISLPNSLVARNADTGCLLAANDAGDRFGKARLIRGRIDQFPCLAPSASSITSIGTGQATHMGCLNSCAAVFHRGCPSKKHAISGAKDTVTAAPSSSSSVGGRRTINWPSGSRSHMDEVAVEHAAMDGSLNRVGLAWAQLNVG